MEIKIEINMKDKDQNIEVVIIEGVMIIIEK